MRHFGHKDRHAGFAIGKMQLPFHLKFPADQRTEKFIDLFLRNGKTVQLPFHPHKKVVNVTLNVLFNTDDITVILVEKIGHGGHQTHLVRAVDQQDRGIVFDSSGHGCQLNQLPVGQLPVKSVAGHMARTGVNQLPVGARNYW
jgi:hypothetical protein